MHLTNSWRGRGLRRRAWGGCRATRPSTCEDALVTYQLGTDQRRARREPAPVDPFDGVLLVSFGGPERPADVLPFLENVTRGRGIPRERLEAVAEHYLRFGGVSPINDQNMALIAALEKEVAAGGLEPPRFLGKRKRGPHVEGARQQMGDGGN